MKRKRRVFLVIIGAFALYSILSPTVLGVFAIFAAFAGIKIPQWLAVPRAFALPLVLLAVCFVVTRKQLLKEDSFTP